MRYIDADEIKIPKMVSELDDTKMRVMIASTPTADVVPVKHGHWMHDSTGANFCSECGMYPYDDGEYHLVWHANYCPNCGAKMDGESK